MIQILQNLVTCLFLDAKEAEKQNISWKAMVLVKTVLKWKRMRPIIREDICSVA